MKYIITSLLILTVCGCQTAKKAPLIVRPSKEIISIHAFKESEAYGVTVRQTNYRLDQNGEVIAESREILSTPRVVGKPNEWLHSNIGVILKGFDSKITYLIDGEMISTPVFAGVNMISKIISFDENKVRVKGIFVSSVFDENRKLISTPLPINVICNLGEETVLYEKEMKFETIK